jgi:hypothetical protein
MVFRSLGHVLEGDLGSDFLDRLDFMSIGVFSMHGKILLPYSETTSYTENHSRIAAYFPTAIKLFQPILGIRIKSEESGEPVLHYQPRLMTLKGQYIEKIKWGTLPWPRKIRFQFLFSDIFLKTYSLRIWRIR